MNPLRWDVLLVGFLLATPVLALGLRGDLTAEETLTRVVWCLAAGWAVVSVLRLATAPRTSARAPRDRRPTAEPADPAGPTVAA